MNIFARTHENAARRGTRARLADRDLAIQAATLRSTIERYADELNQLLVGASSCSEAMHLPGMCRLFDVNVITDRMAGIKNRDDRLLESELQKARDLGPMRRLATPPSTLAINRLLQAFPHFAAVIELVRQRSALAEVSPGRVFSMPPVLLAGEPGLGKTAFCEALAKILGLPTKRLDMAAATASFVLSGSHSSWSGARPGAIWSLLQSPMASGLVLLDEIDKASGGNYPPISPLYRLLEPFSAKTFADEFTELEMDASHLLWFATCNDPSLIDSALRSRFTEYEIVAPTTNQMLAIARSVYRDRRNQSTWGALFPEELDDSAAEQLTACTPRELAGILEVAVARAAVSRRLKVTPSDIAYARESRKQRDRQVQRLGFI
jgi:ATP-dependent Lon protease